MYKGWGLGIYKYVQRFDHKYDRIFSFRSSLFDELTTQPYCIITLCQNVIIVSFVISFLLDTLLFDVSQLVV
jgi:hypothetical protein